MQVEEIRTVLRAALSLRVPAFDPNEHGRSKVEKLEDYMSQVAIARGDLEEALYWGREAGRVLADHWNAIEGYEVQLRSRERTERNINEAKRRLDPTTWEGIQEAKRLVEDLGRQIRRLELDHDAVSRLYTLITGAA